MENCYRSTPKLVGALIDAIYQNPTTLLIAIVGIAGLAGMWWYKVGKKSQ